MIRYNHIGYRCNAPKFFLIDNPEEEVFCIQTLDESLVWKDYYTSLTGGMPQRPSRPVPLAR